MIASLGGSLVDDPEIRKSLLNSLHVLRENISPSGCIPNNIDASSGRPNFRATADGGLWWVIGSSILEPDLETIARILQWYECQDVDQSDLLSMQESSDWQDLFCTRGKGLYLNCLYVLALRRAAGVDNRFADEWLHKASLVTEAINRYFWYAGDENMLRHIAHSFSTESPQEQDSLGRKRWLPVKQKLQYARYYLPYLAFRSPGEWFDVLGNVLAILSGVADATQAAYILDFIDTHELARLPAKAIYPPVEPGDAEWRDYYGMLNLPDCYHNGGVWPFIGGFYVAALVYANRIGKARETLIHLEALNADGEFNEWHHGATGEALGVRDQAWSAAMYIYAARCVEQGSAIYLV